MWSRRGEQVRTSVSVVVEPHAIAPLQVNVPSHALPHPGAVWPSRVVLPTSNGHDFGLKAKTAPRQTAERTCRACTSLPESA